jgi:hypothetical protein
MKTAVEQFWDKIALKLSVEQLNEILPLFEQAKEMEKEQKANTWNNAINAVEKNKWESFEHYYNETYEGK